MNWTDTKSFHAHISFAIYMKIYIPVTGGLGNQMFIYAFYQSLIAQGYNPCLLWRDYIHTYTHNGIELLKIFPNIEETSSPAIGHILKINSHLNDLTRTFIRKSISLLDKRYRMIRQKNPYSFDSFDIKSNKDTILKGYWQNQNYFCNIEDTIRDKFSFKVNTNLNFEFFKRKIQTTNSVSIHIRRGDYLKNTFSDFNVIKDNNYYLKSIDFIKNKISDPIFFIFSDDLDWCRSQFGENGFIYVDGNYGENSYLDMQLMSLCNHNIIANSTFSWWGAWLNKNKNKIVCMPDLWTNYGILSSSFCPPSWIPIKTF